MGSQTTEPKEIRKIPRVQVPKPANAHSSFVVSASACAYVVAAVHWTQLLGLLETSMLIQFQAMHEGFIAEFEYSVWWL